MKTPKEIIESKGYKLYADDSLLEKVPRSDGKKKVEVFKLDRYMTNEEVAEEYEMAKAPKELSLRRQQMQDTQ